MTELLHMKEEPEELWSSQEGEQLQGPEEVDIKFTYAPVCVKSEGDEEMLQSLHPHELRTEEMKRRADGEDCGRPEADRYFDPERDAQAETEVKTESEDSSKAESDNADWRETLEHKLHICCECGDRFKLTASLRDTMRIQTGEKPFSCSNCSKMNNHGTTSLSKKKKDALYLTDEQQDDMIQWLKENPILYNRKLKEYRNTEKKRKLWKDKAQELDVNPHRLQTWVDSMRTRFGRLTQTKSGQAAKEHTDRENWILEKFSFLAEHIARQTSRHGVSLMKKTESQAAAGPSYETFGDVASEDEDDEEQGDHLNLPATGQPPRKTPLTKKSKMSASADQYVEIAAQLAQRAESSHQPQERIGSLFQSADDAQLSRRGWGQWIAGMMAYMEQDVIQSFYDQSFSLVMSHVRRSAQVKEQRKQQTTQQQQFQPIQQQQQFQPIQQQQFQPIQTTQQQQYYHPISGQRMNQPSTCSASQVRSEWDTASPSVPCAVPVRSTPRESTNSLGFDDSLSSLLG